MKKLVILLINLIAVSSLAGTSKAFKAVVDMPQVKSLHVISKVELKQIYRCPQCFQFLVEGTRMNRSGQTRSVGFLVETKIDDATQAVVATKVHTP